VPDDHLPDFLGGGVVDDAAVLTFTAGLVRTTLEDFVAWERRHTTR
jgi:uncharacterized membrane protein YkvA (DUF1232 family)